MSQVLPAVGNVLTQCSAWFLQIMNAVDGLPVWMTGVLVFLSYRFLLKPLFGYAESDSVDYLSKKIRQSKEEE